MKKLKDFIYDKNDILIAVLILVVAAAIIAWRMEIILNYPKTLVSSGTTTEEPKNTDASKSDADKTDKNTKADESDAKDDPIQIIIHSSLRQLHSGVQTEHLPRM